MLVSRVRKPSTDNCEKNSLRTFRFDESRGFVDERSSDFRGIRTCVVLYHRDTTQLPDHRNASIFVLWTLTKSNGIRRTKVQLKDTSKKTTSTSTQNASNDEKETRVDSATDSNTKACIN